MSTDHLLHTAAPALGATDGAQAAPTQVRWTRRQGLGLLSTAVAAWAGWIAPPAWAQFGDGAVGPAAPALGKPVPELAGISAWVNSAPLTLAQLRGQVVLLEFWTLGCINCVHTLPQITAWDSRYRARGLVVLGVHTPEFAQERELDAIKSAVARHAIRYPVAVDNDYRTWTAYANRYWPAMYLIDDQGRLAHMQVGEGRYDELEQRIERLLAARAAGAGRHA